VKVRKMLRRSKPVRGVAPSPSLIRTKWSGTAPAALVLLLVMAGILFVGCSALQSPPARPQGQITIAGSTALQPLVTQAAQRFMQANPKVKITVTGGGSLVGLQEVNGHRIDIGDSDVYADPATYPDPNLTDHLVAVIPFAMITNLDVNITNLSTNQIIAIYSTGTIHNWQQVGGPNLAIVPVVRPATSGTRATFRKYVLGGRDEQGKLLQSDSSQTVVHTVADTPGAIGYLALSVLNSSVREVAIDGQLPSVKTIQTGQYAFWGFEHMYTIGLGSPAMMSFLNYMLTSQIQQLAEKLGYFPIAAMAVASRHGNNTGNGNTVEAAVLYRPWKDGVPT
jgi:phosphate transport system substrate-binding protein